MAKKRGRPPLPVSLHILNGTFRPDRHGPRPDKVAHGQEVRVPAPTCTAAEVQLDGAALMAAIRRDWQVDDQVGLTYLRAAGSSQDRRQALAALLDGPEGLLARLAKGETGLSAKAVEVILKAERQASEDLSIALDRLHLDDVKPVASGQRVAS